MKNSLFFKIISLILIQTFLVFDFAFSAWQESSFQPVEKQSGTLSPQIHVGINQFQKIFVLNLDIQKGSLNSSADSRQAVFEAANLKNGREKLDFLITEKIAPIEKPLIMYIDGNTSSGKTTLKDLIKKKGIAGISVAEIAFISLDDIYNDLYQQGYDKLSTVLEIPLVLSDKIEQAKDKKIIVVEGREASSYLKEAGYEPDMAVIIEAPPQLRLKRHLMRYGLLGIKFWLEDRFPAYTPEDTLVLKIKNEQDIQILRFLGVAALRTLTTTITYVMPDKITDLYKDALYWTKHQVKSVVLEKLKTVREAVNIVNIILFPLWLLSFIVNKMFDFYLLFQPSRNMLSIIKTRFGNRHIEVLDIGTGDGTFVERFQNLLDKKGIRAKVTGIDIRAAGISLGMSLNRNVRGMDVKDLYAHYATREFDLIFVNAPGAPEFAVRQAMKVLKPNGLLVLRMVKVYQSKEDKEYVVKNLKKEYEVKVLNKALHNLPTGAYYKLQKPVLVEHKRSSFSNNNPGNNILNRQTASVHDLQEFLEKFRAGINKLIDEGKLPEAADRLNQLRARSLDLSKEKLRLIEALKQRADYLFLSQSYPQALKFYQMIPEVDPKQTSAYFYIGAIHLVESNINLARNNFDKAKQGDPRSPIYNLANFMVEAIILSREIVQLARSKDPDIKYNSNSAKLEKIKRYEKVMNYIQYIQVECEDVIDGFAQNGGVDSVALYQFIAKFIEELENFERISRKISYFLNGEKISFDFDIEARIETLKGLNKESNQPPFPGENLERVKPLLRFPSLGVDKFIAQAI